MTDNDRLGAAIEQHVSKLEVENKKLKEEIERRNESMKIAKIAFFVFIFACIFAGARLIVWLIDWLGGEPL